MLSASYTWTCCACHRSETQTWEISVAESLHQNYSAPRPAPPAGWGVVHGHIYCPDHTPRLRMGARVRAA